MVEFIIKNTIKNNLRKQTREKKFLNMNQVRSVFIVFEAVDYALVDTFVKQLKRLGKQVTGIAFRTKDDSRDYSKAAYKVISNADLDWMGKPDLAVRSFVKEQKDDVLIDLTMYSNLVLEYLVSISEIPFKIGIRKSRPLLYDLSIVDSEPEENVIQEKIQQIVYYLNTIQSA